MNSKETERIQILEAALIDCLGLARLGDNQGVVTAASNALSIAGHAALRPAADKMTDALRAADDALSQIVGPREWPRDVVREALGRNPH